MVSRSRSMKGKASRKKSDKQRCLEFLDARRGEEWSPKPTLKFLKGVSYESARKNFRRLADDPSSPVVGRQSGNVTFFSIPTGIQTDDDIAELERKMGELIAIEPQKIPQYHNIQLYIKKSNWDKSVAPLPTRLKSIFSKNPLDPACPSQLWPKDKVTKKLKGGFQEDIRLSDRIVTYQIFSSGKMNIYVNSSQNPIDLEEWPAVAQWISGMLYARCGATIDELRPAISVCWEYATDIFNEELHGALTGSGKFSITLNTFDDMTHRMYVKHFKDGRLALRSEMAVNEPQPMSEFLRANIVQQMGGVSQQYLVRELTQQNRTLQNIDKSLQVRDNAITFNQQVNKRLGMEMKDLGKDIEEVADQLGVKLSKREPHRPTPVRPAPKKSGRKKKPPRYSIMYS